jgi:L-histidine Nalpha-methyltransferase
MDAKVKQVKVSHNEFLDDVIQGLESDNKTLPCKYFYDEKGSNLFEAICDLDEYYITRTELKLIESIKHQLADLIGKNAVIIEPGAGAGKKIQTLLSALDSPALYVPTDISKDFLFYSAQKIQQRFPKLDVMPLQGDFSQPFTMTNQPDLNNRVVFFPGSTIGNFTPPQAQAFLENQAQLVGDKGAIIIGFDLVKSSETLEAAYNDDVGVTAEFNKNLLQRINNELGGNFDLDNFEHEAIFNQDESRIEMHLISKTQQAVCIDEQQFEFEENETIHTENSYKYSSHEFIQLAQRAGLKSVKHWLDDNNLIAMHYLVPNQC